LQWDGDGIFAVMKIKSSLSEAVAHLITKSHHNVIKCRYFIIGLSIALMTAGCNSSVNSVLKNPNNLKYSEADKCIPMLPVYFDIESVYSAFMQDKKTKSYNNRFRNEWDVYSEDIYDAFQKIATNDLAKNVYSSQKSARYNGYIRARIVSAKTSAHCAMIAPTILTLGVSMLCGAPVAHGGVECNYMFDVFDCFGNVIKSYPVKSYVRQYAGLYQMFGDTSIRGVMAASYRKAVAIFEKCLMEDKNLIVTTLRNSNAKMDKAKVQAAELMDQKGLNAFEDYLQYSETQPKLLLRKLNEVLNYDQNNVYARMFRSFARTNSCDYTGALSDISAYADVNPTCQYSHPYAYKATLLGILGRNFESLVEADKAVFYDGNSADSWLALGRSYGKLRLYKEGVAALKKCVELNPNYIEVHTEIQEMENELERVSTNRQMHEAYISQLAMNAISRATNAITSNVTTVSQILSPQKGSAVSSVENRNKVSSLSTGNSRTSIERVECSNCHGKGTVAGTSTVSFSSSSTYYCEECHREVPSSHSHDRCPSCMGKGYITRIKR